MMTASTVAPTAPTLGYGGGAIAQSPHHSPQTRSPAPEYNPTRTSPGIPPSFGQDYNTVNRSQQGGFNPGQGPYQTGR